MVNGYTASSLKEALTILAETNAVPYAGGTDLMLENRPGVKYLFLKKIPELRSITADERYIRIGAAVTFTEALASPLVPPLMKEAVSHIAAPAIRNAGTFGGNIGNGSDKADTVVVEFAADAKARIVSKEKERIADIDKVFLSRKHLGLSDGELIAEILLPRKGLERYAYTKVGGRQSQAVSFVSFAGVFGLENGRITNAAAAFGAAGDAVQRYRDIEKSLIGKTPDEAKKVKADYLRAYEERILVNQSRVGPAYQRIVCLNLLNDFLSRFGV